MPFRAEDPSCSPSDVSFTDPGYPDTQTASIDWDDGTIDTAFDLFSDARFGALGLLQHAHAFSAAGTYGIGVAVTDDDGGVATVLLPLEVLSPAYALEAVIDAIDALIAGGGSAAELRALQRARDGKRSFQLRKDLHEEQTGSREEAGRGCFQLCGIL